MLPGDNKINKGGFTFVTNCPFMTCRSNTNLYCNTFKFICGIRHLAPLQLIEWGGLFMTDDLKRLRWTKKHERELCVNFDNNLPIVDSITNITYIYIEVLRFQWLVDYMLWYGICIFIKMYIVWINYYHLEARE